MTAQELTKSIIEYHLKAQYAIYAKPSNSDFIKQEGEKIYKSYSAFIEYYKTNCNREHNIRISAKQAGFLQSLMQRERLQDIKMDNITVYHTNPNIPFSAYGGFVGKKRQRLIEQVKKISIPYFCSKYGIWATLSYRDMRTFTDNFCYNVN